MDANLARLARYDNWRHADPTNRKQFGVFLEAHNPKFNVESISKPLDLVEHWVHDCILFSLVTGESKVFIDLDDAIRYGYEYLCNIEEGGLC